MMIDELKKIIEAHQRWLNGEENGCRADLCRANLCGANLCDADLCGANLCGANLCDADLCGANLCRANLCGANLCDADLCRANLCRADLCGANLCGANLCDADLCGANLRGAKQKIISIKGSRHQIVAIDDDIHIGCQRFALEKWLSHYPKIGAANGYSEAEIAEYGIYLKAIEQVLLLRAGEPEAAKGEGK
jgi:hypothetical protein